MDAYDVVPLKPVPVEKELYNLSSTWLKIEMWPGKFVFYDWKNKLFSMSPVFDAM